MQTHSRFQIIGLLLAVFISGSFALSAPQKTSAAMNTMAGHNNMPSSQQKACAQKNCVKTQNFCEKFCFNQATEKTTPPAISTHWEYTPIHFAPRVTFSHPEFNTIFFVDSKRAPPAHAFLRSVVKRE